MDSMVAFIVYLVGVASLSRNCRGGQRSKKIVEGFGVAIAGITRASVTLCAQMCSGMVSCLGSV